MKRIIYKSSAIKAVIWILAATVLLSLWPFRILQETVTSSIPVQTGATTQVVDNTKTVLQSFVAQYAHLGSIRLYLGAETQGESFYVRLLDEAQVMIAEEEVSIDVADLPGYVTVLMDVDTEVGKLYHCIVEGKDSSVFLGCEWIPMADMPYAAQMYYVNQPQEGMNLVADYNYRMPMRKGKVLWVGGITVLLAAFALYMVRLFYGTANSSKRQQRDKLITVERAFKCIMNPLLALFTVAGIICVLAGFCGSYVLDNTVFVVSILLLSGILFYGINHNRDGQAPILTVDYIKSHLPDLFQSVCIAGAIAACCEYMNGLYDIHHALAERKEMIWLALAVIAMFKWKEVFRIYNLVYVIVAGIGGYFYYRSSVLRLAEQTIKETEIDWHLQIIRNTVVIAILLGLIVIRTILGLCKKKLSRPYALMGGLLALFFAAIIIFRNGRWWTVVLAVSFTLFYLTYGMWENKGRLLVNICRGVVLQFLLATGYALLHRPFVTYKTARYPHIFHTVTITATYLTMVECVAIVMLLTKFAKSQKLKDIWKELCFFGVVSSYLLFTMARTGLLAVAVTLVIGMVIMTVGKGKEWLLHLLQAGGFLLLSVLICMPITFSVQRTVPAIASDPILFEIESYPDDIMRGRKLSSMQYMRVGRFIDVFSEKIFNIPEGTFDIYGEIETYKQRKAVKLAAQEALEAASQEMPEKETSEKETSEQGALEQETPVKLEYEDIDQSKLDMEAVTEIYEELAEMKPEQTEAEGDYTNGRIDIFRSYLEQLNMTGHEEMGALLPDGSIATHAHDIYLQIAYDHGIPTAILFLLVGAVIWIYAWIFYKKKRMQTAYCALPVVITTAVAIAGIVEWIFHLSNPCGLMLMLVITPLVFREEQ